MSCAGPCSLPAREARTQDSNAFLIVVRTCSYTQFRAGLMCVCFRTVDFGCFRFELVACWFGLYFVLLHIVYISVGPSGRVLTLFRTCVCLLCLAYEV
jgi:uncharacterized membrane protein YuzA (DUF378 family)